MACNLIKYSKLNLRSSDFSLREESMDSQILSSPRSLSITSEPSDLKNWFPSYQYESPALNSNSFLDDTVVPETEMDENSGGFERNGTKNEAFIPKNETPNGVVKCGSFSGYEHESHLLSKIPSSLESTSFVSEPTDIRNWYSSYVYESPSLDATDDVGNSICEVSKHKEDGFLVENNRGKEKVSEDFSTNRSDSEEVNGRAPQEKRQPVRRTPGPLEPPSQLSEPSDIRNWFSSYVYESLSYDTSTTDGFRDPFWKENKSGKDGFLVDNSHRENEEDLEGYNRKRTDGEAVADIHSEGLAECITSWRVNKQKIQPGRPSSSQNDLCLKHMPKSWKTKVIAQAQDAEKSILKKESSQCKLSPKTFKGTKIKPSNNERSSCSRNDEKSTQDMTSSKAFTLQGNSEAAEVDCILTGSDSDLIPSNGVLERKPTHGSTDSKDVGNEISENGFITTRKGKLTRNNQEKIVERPQEISKMTAPIVMKRKALADATNIHHSPAAGIAGKWKCPQKSKSNRGPTLKQLRLEKWERKGMSASEVRDFVNTLLATFSFLQVLSIPTIAVIEVAALGGGLEMALSCDLRMCGEDAVMGLPETGLAIIPGSTILIMSIYGAGGTQRLPRLVGKAISKEPIFTGRKIGGREAMSIDLVNYCVPAGEAHRKALEVARNINEKGPIAIRMAKKAIDEGLEVDKTSALALEEQCHEQTLNTNDRLEALAAFSEK